jgi:hypothetical protein
MNVKGNILSITDMRITLHQYCWLSIWKHVSVLIWTISMLIVIANSCMTPVPAICVNLSDQSFVLAQPVLLGVPVSLPQFHCNQVSALLEVSILVNQVGEKDQEFLFPISEWQERYVCINSAFIVICYTNHSFNFHISLHIELVI